MIIGRRHVSFRGGMERKVVGENGALMLTAKPLALDGEFPVGYFVHLLSAVG